MADDALMSQDEIERLLGQVKESPLAKGPAGSPSPSPAPAPRATTDADMVQSQQDIEKLLKESARGVRAPAVAAVPAREAPSSPPVDEASITQQDIEYLLNQAERALESVDSPHDDAPPGATPFQLKEFGGSTASTEVATLDLIRDVELDLKIELGRTNMYLEDVLKLRRGSVVPLDKLAGDPVDVYVNDRLVARGEVLVLNDNFCVRVAELIVGAEA
jgi:flagellar motor switch protein FliN